MRVPSFSNHDIRNGFLAVQRRAVNSVTRGLPISSGRSLNVKLPECSSVVLPSQSVPHVPKNLLGSWGQAMNNPQRITPSLCRANSTIRRWSRSMSSKVISSSAARRSSSSPCDRKNSRFFREPPAGKLTQQRAIDAHHILQMRVQGRVGDRCILEKRPHVAFRAGQRNDRVPPRAFHALSFGCPGEAALVLPHHPAFQLLKGGGERFFPDP
jgi:hypothetical protein